MQNHTQPFEILLVEEDPFSRQGIQAYLEQSGHSVHPTTTLVEALNILNEHLFDIAILDIAIPADTSDNSPRFDNGLSLLRHIKQNWPTTGVIVWSAFIAEHKKTMISLFEEGHHGIAFLPKGSGVEIIADAIMQVSNGNVLLSREAVQRYNSRSDKVLLDLMTESQGAAVVRVAERFHLLSPQELKLVGQINLNNQEIADVLGVRPRTVTNYLDKVYEKLGFRDLEMALTQYDRRSLISLAALLHQLRESQ